MSDQGRERAGVSDMGDEVPGGGFPFLDHIGLVVREHGPDGSVCALTIAPMHMNSTGRVHGAVLFALADTGMGAALTPTLARDQACATVELKINYFKPVRAGELTCSTQVVNRGRTLANMESSIYLNQVLVARANGTFAIFARSA